MPNWISNNLYVKCATKEQAEEVLRRVKGDEEEFDFNRIIPMPDSIANSDGNTIVPWARENWGTKWNASNASVEISDSFAVPNVVNAYFETAWSAPLPVIQALSRMFPGAEMTIDTHYEDGENLPTHVVFKDGDQLFYGEWGTKIIDEDTDETFDSWDDVPEDHQGHWLEQRIAPEKTAWYGGPKSGFCGADYN